MNIALDKFGNPILEQFSEEGFIDCVLRIEDLIESTEHFNFHLTASSEGEVLGMDVAVRKDIQAGFDHDMNLVQERVYRNGVVFIRSGEESDRLISRIAALYGLPFSERAMVPKETFTAIALHQGEIDLRSRGVKIKLFGRDQEPFEEDAYYESFFNLDLPGGFVYWNEKDQDYRRPLIAGLSKEIKPDAAGNDPLPHH